MNKLNQLPLDKDQWLLDLIEQLNIDDTPKSSFHYVLPEEAAQILLNQKPHKKRRMVYDSQSLNSLVVGLTQSGKTEYVICMLKHLTNAGCDNIVSCDNKIDQMKQMMSRMKGVILSCKMSKTKLRKQLLKCIQQDTRFTIVCMDNAAQVNKIHNLLKDVDYQGELTFFHDEGDTLQKPGQSQAVKAWNYLFTYIQQKNIIHRRIFISATPENIIDQFDIMAHNVFNIPTKQQYTGFDKIRFVPVENLGKKGDENEENTVLQTLQRCQEEIEEIETQEAVLVVTQRKTKEQRILLLKIASQFPNALVHTYNGKGQEVYCPLEYQDSFTKAVECIPCGAEGETFHCKLTIQEFYTACKNLPVKMVVTIGKDLINRGISFVSSGENPLCATRMILSCGAKLPATTLNQTIGRILGNACPEKQRILYSSERVYLDYLVYNTNQKNYISHVKTKPEGFSVKKALKEPCIIKSQETYDRPTDKCKIDETLFKGEKKVERNFTAMSLEHVHQTVKKWWGESSLIGKILRLVYQQDVTEEELKTYLRQNSSTHPESYCSQLTKQNKIHSYIFDLQNKVFSIKPSVKQYIDNLK